MNKVEELVDDFARIIHRQKFPAGLWDRIVIKEPWLEVARDYFKNHPDFALITKCERCDGRGLFHSEGYEYGEDKPITCSECQGTGIIPIPLAEALKDK